MACTHLGSEADSVLSLLMRRAALGPGLAGLGEGGSPGSHRGLLCMWKPSRGRLACGLGVWGLGLGAAARLCQGCGRACAVLRKALGNVQGHRHLAPVGHGMAQPCGPAAQAQASAWLPITWLRTGIHQHCVRVEKAMGQGAELTC